MEFLNEDKRIWNDLTDEEKGRLLLAYYEGKTIQECGDNGYKWEDWHDVQYDDCYPPKWQHGIWRIKPEPVKQVHWCNDYKDGTFGWYAARKDAEKAHVKGRIAVIRREIVDGVVSYFKEDV